MTRLFRKEATMRRLAIPALVLLLGGCGYSADDLSVQQAAVSQCNTRDWVYASGQAASCDLAIAAAKAEFADAMIGQWEACVGRLSGLRLEKYIRRENIAPGACSQRRDGTFSHSIQQDVFCNCATPDATELPPHINPFRIEGCGDTITEWASFAYVNRPGTDEKQTVFGSAVTFYDAAMERARAECVAACPMAGMWWDEGSLHGIYDDEFLAPLGQFIVRVKGICSILPAEPKPLEGTKRMTELSRPYTIGDNP